MRYSSVKATAGENFLITAADRQGDRRGGLFRSMHDAQLCVEGLLNQGVPPARINVFRVRPLPVPVAVSQAARG